MTFSDSFWRSVIRLSTLFEMVAIVLSSAELRSNASFMKFKKVIYKDVEE